MVIEWVDNPTCDACGEPATHVDTGVVGRALPPDKGWACDDTYHSMSIDFEPIEKVFGDNNE